MRYVPYEAWLCYTLHQVIRPCTVQCYPLVPRNVLTQSHPDYPCPAVLSNKVAVQANATFAVCSLDVCVLTHLPIKLGVPSRMSFKQQSICSWMQPGLSGLPFSLQFLPVYVCMCIAHHPTTEPSIPYDRCMVSCTAQLPCLCTSEHMS